MTGELDPDDGIGRLESGEDARLQIAEFTGLEKFSLVVNDEYGAPWLQEDRSANETRGLLDGLEKGMEGWKAPEVHLARIVR